MVLEMQVFRWVIGVLFLVFFAGLYFWQKQPTLPKPSIFEIMDETEAEILTEVEKAAEEREEQKDLTDEPERRHKKKQG